MNVKIWYNALFNSISGGHTESIDAINSWDWFIGHNAYVIQTDYPFHLVKYLNQLGLHERLTKEDQYDLTKLPVREAIEKKELIDSSEIKSK
jgi:hypothetical protein